MAPTPNPPDRLVLTVAEAAAALRIGRNQAYAAVRRGQIPAVRIGRRLLVPRRAIEELVAAFEEERGSRASR
jgi:excisionase family DNA binding protein